jgi:FtsX-like permease family
MNSAPVVLAWLRLDLRRRWRSLAVLMLLVAIAGATVITALAGARRGASALSRLNERTLPATSAILANTPGFDWSKIRKLPEVAALTTFVVDYSYRFEGLPDYGSNAFPPADDQTMRTIEKPVIYSGRLFDPKRADEVVVTRQFVAQEHKGIGDVLVLDLPNAKQLAEQVDAATGVRFLGPKLRMRIVGIVGSPWFSDQTGSHGQIIMSPGVAAKYPLETIGNQGNRDDLAFVNALIRLHGGEAAIPQLRADVARLTGRSDIDIWDIPEQERAEQHSIAFESRCLAAFAAAAFAAALFLVGQAIARYAAATVAELQTMRALGMTPRQAIVTAAAGPSISGLLGSGLAALAAFLASHWTPIGSASLIEPSPGLTVDWVVFGPAIALIALLVSGSAALSAWLAVGAARRGASFRRSAVAAAASRAGLPVPVVVGTRFALESGRGRTAVPVRPALVGAVAGVLGILAAFTFAHGVSDAASKPERFGQTFQLDSYAGINGQDFGPAKTLISATVANKAVTGVDDARTAVASGPHGDGSVSLYAYGGSTKALPVVVTSGRMPQGADEVLLAPSSLSALDTRVGGRVALTGNKGSSTYVVTGTGFVPEGPHNGYADGGWVTQAGYDTLFKGFKFHIVLVSLQPGARNPKGFAALNTAVAKANPALAGAYEPVDPPSALAELREVRVLPILLGAFLALLAVGAVGHALATAVRRRSHDLAVLRALGLTQWQCRWITLTQATVVAAIGLIFGVPLGLAIGRLVWRAVADYTPLQYVPPLAIWALALVGPVVLLISSILAAWPGHRAARLRVASILRAE